MDWLLEIKDQLEKSVFDQVADLLNLEVDLLFFDTTSHVLRDRGGRRAGSPATRTATPSPAEMTRKDGKDAGFRTCGKSKDHRDDLPQVVIGMAVTRDGIPVRVWCWPGNTTDSALIRQVKDDMRDWSLSRVVWVADRGFTSAENRRYLRKGGGPLHHRGEAPLRLRRGRAPPCPGRAATRTSPGTCKVKEVRIAEDERFVICFNPEAAERDAAIRARMIAQLNELIEDSDTLSQGQARRAARRHLHQAWPEPLPARHPRRPAPHRRREGQGRGEPRRQVPAAHLRPEADRRGHRPGLQAAPGSRARLARHEAGHRPAPRLPPQRRAHPRPRHPLLARPPARPHRRERLRRHLARSCAASSTASTSAPSPAPPAPSASAPRSAKPQRDILARLENRPAPEDLPAHTRRRPADQREPHRLDTRPPTRPGRIPARQTARSTD